jgi:multiple sugar transport system permease protein
MSLVGKVGRRKPRAVFATALVYLFLSVGALTTLYPFMLMVSTGFKGPTDENDNSLVPKFWFDKEELLTKYVADKYRQDAGIIASTRSGPTAPLEVLHAYEKFLMALPATHWKAGFGQGPNQMTSRLDVIYREWLRQKFHGDIELYNTTYLEEQTTFDAITTPAELLERANWKPKPGVRWNDWIAFKNTLPAEFRIPITARQLFQTFLKSKFRNAFDQVPAEVKGKATKFEEVGLPTSGELLTEFNKTTLPSRFLTQTTDAQWATLAGPGVGMPFEAFERELIQDKGGPIRGELSTRNFRFVLNFILFHGRALWNTAIFALLLIGTQLIVNPLAAYALSRYPVKASAKILLFLLATMAFPAEVAMIPSFLLLKGLGLLNTFAALVLPVAASGYMIFLLKGFFDSLPQELFEAGQIDGAKETTLMMRVALPLSKPVLGYMALLAFMAAYGSFLYAFLVAQDQKMWTLMVYFYQLQVSGAPRALLMAALTLGALPTLIVFLLCQRVIMRGIVLPGER